MRTAQTDRRMKSKYRENDSKAQISSRSRDTSMSYADVSAQRSIVSKTRFAIMHIRVHLNFMNESLARTTSLIYKGPKSTRPGLKHHSVFRNPHLEYNLKYNSVHDCLRRNDASPARFPRFPPACGMVHPVSFIKFVQTINRRTRQSSVSQTRFINLEIATHQTRDLDHNTWNRIYIFDHLCWRNVPEQREEWPGLGILFLRGHPPARARRWPADDGQQTGTAHITSVTHAMYIIKSIFGACGHKYNPNVIFRCMVEVLPSTRLLDLNNHCKHSHLCIWYKDIANAFNQWI